MKQTVAILILACFGMVPALSGAALQIDPSKAVIVTEKHPCPVQAFAAKELQKHLALVCTRTIPVVAAGEQKKGDYPFFIGGPLQKGKFLPEEAFWSISADGVRIEGDDEVSGANPLPRRTGTLYALYDFLEKNFGFQWLFPGDKGICGYTVGKILTLAPGKGHWLPRLQLRQIRPNYNEPFRIPMPRGMEVTREQQEPVIQENRVWLKRQRMGGSVSFGIGHAFTDWWQKFGTSHPEYFALQPDGTRGPGNRRPNFVKLCVSDPGVPDQIVSDWKSAPIRTKIINVAENDSDGYCTCPDCRALDVLLPGEKPLSILTDRYVRLANEVLKRAETIDPEVWVGMYAYANYTVPPRRERVSPKMVAGIVSSMGDLKATEELFAGWNKAGLRKIYLRPNDHHMNIGLPVGFERSLYEHFQLALRYGAVGTDFDSLYGFWPTTGIADYILARAHIDPAQSFDALEEEYCRAYGDAAPEIKAYFRYWRTHVWEKIIQAPEWKHFLAIARYGDITRHILRNIGQFYKLEDFDRTDAILARAAAKKLPPREKALVEMQVLSNRHARMTFQAMAALPAQKLEWGRKLLKFRAQHREDLPIFWMMVNFVEQRYNDIPGTGEASALAEYQEVLPLPKRWRFRTDPDRAGEKEKWESLSSSDWEKHEPISVTAPWEKQSPGTMPSARIRELKKYNGIAYYAIALEIPETWRGRQVDIYFGGVAKDAKVYLNGKLLEDRPFRGYLPFSVRIDPGILQDRKKQILVVRCDDLGDEGGVWRPAFLCVK